MKTQTRRSLISFTLLYSLFAILPASRGQQMWLNRPAVSARAGAVKSFQIVQVQHTYQGGGLTNVAITPNAAGHTLVAYAINYGGSAANISIHDTNANTWVQQCQTNGNCDGPFQMVLATCLSCLPQTTSIYYTGDGPTASTLVVAEFSGVTGIDSAAVAGQSGPTSVLNLTASQADGFYACWVNEGQGDVITSCLLAPGSVAGNLDSHDANQYGASWDWLNGGFGFSAGAYTLTFTATGTTCNVMEGISFY